ncbi:hypothetical protein Athai_14240 [Actinocatenispora thailandica]|uniref:Uncharacterized protein n=1 Tax=Actinocatenispora thailandica TaxID=227318 RepID=A0A7R7HVR8_9ACTN|nr:hypothetical protein [Actinocatenispora thailandica]BCJ33921.1 hypothetical protein Athai_14240 [Actinocatenispora thailandica]
MPETAPPEPTAPADRAAFMVELRRLKAWSGRSYRQLERRARAAGDTLPYSTAASMLGRDRLPREELLVAFVRACGIDDVRPWAAARAALDQGAPPRTDPDRAPVSMQPADLGPAPGSVRTIADHTSIGAERGRGYSIGAAQPGTPPSPGSRWVRPPQQLVAAAVLLVALAVALAVGVTYTVGGHTANVTHTVLDR